VVAVSFSPKKAFKEFQKRLNTGFKFYWDPDKSFYAQYGMGRTFTKMFGLKTIYWFVESVTTGKVHKAPDVEGDDVYMMSGDVVFNNATSEPVYTFLPDSVVERPDVDTVCKILHGYK